MIFLRLLALLAGGLVLILPPVLVAEHSHTGMPAWIAVGGLAGLALVALSYLYIAALGGRMRRSGHTRVLGGLLLLIPAVGGLTMLATRTDPTLLWGSALLVSFTMLLFISFVYPASPDRRQRPMRRRERTEPALVLVQRHPSAERRGSRF
jgi:peptidoglycan/LPS O-acetylase OafA/YrhL